MFTSQLGQTPGILQREWIRERRFDLARPGERVAESVAEAQLSFPYFWRKRSTRPAVSISFCLPV